MRKVVPVIIVLLLIVLVGGGIAYKVVFSKYTPTEDLIDYESAIGLKDGEYAITLDHELLSDYRAIGQDGRVYLDFELVSEHINSRFYYDEEEDLCIYSNQSRLLLFTPDRQKYEVRSWTDESTADEGYTVFIRKDDTLYVAADYVKANTKMDYAEYTSPNRVVMNTSWDSVQVVVSQKKTPIRYRGGIKGEVLRYSEEEERMYLIEAYDDWFNVATDDGYIGWVSTKACSLPQAYQEAEPDFTEPEYTSLTRDYKIIMAWHQVMNTTANASVSSVIASSPGVNVISPTWFYFAGTDGSIGSVASYDYVSTCHSNDIEVWALFSNEFTNSEGERVFDYEKTEETIGSLTGRQKAISQIIGYANEYDIDGINLDFEAILSEDADSYVEFVRELSIACRANGLVLSINNYVPEYTYYYNRREQGIVADYVITMCYDEYTGGSDTTGPVASSSYVSKGISDTLDQVDKSKVIIGIPFFSRVWCTAEDGSITSFACGMEEAEGYLSAHDTIAKYQDESGLNYGSYISDKDGGFYEIWLQDEDAVRSELNMISDAEVAGCACWKSGYESGTAVWNIISKALN